MNVTYIVFGLMLVIASILFMFYTKYSQMITAKIGVENMNTLKAVAEEIYKFVLQAEFTKALIGKGKEKKAFVLSQVKCFLSKFNLILDEELLDNLIENAVAMLRANGEEVKSQKGSDINDKEA